jgi:hypothetical protein
VCTAAIFRGAESAMTNAFVLRMGRVVATILVVAFASGAQLACGQTSTGNILPNGLLPLLSNQPAPNAVSTAGYQQPMNMPNMPRRSPMARLIDNPDQTDGAPPFALTDQTGTIQRYVEPVPGIELASHVGQVVTVRNDTGATLLASQLELPPQALRPMVGNPDERYAAATNAAGNWRRAPEPANVVQQVQYVDNDDASVQLLPDEGAVDPSGMATGSLMPLDGMPQGMPQGGEFPPYAEPIGPPMVGPMVQPNMPMQYPPGMMGYPTGACDAPPARARLSADVELMLLRPQIAESAVGKLSEEYQFSPRLILELQGAGNFDGRLRYWHYSRASDVLEPKNNLSAGPPLFFSTYEDYLNSIAQPLSASPGKQSIKITFDVLDIEALHHFAARKSELTLSAGLRLAGLHLTDTDWQKSSTNLIGLTMAGDGMTPLGEFPGGHFGIVYGGRLSILAGNWGGDDNSQFVNQQTRNDNVLVHELYGGVELARRCGPLDVSTRLLFEMQNWHSDVLAQNAGLDSIGIFGPALQFGAEF